MVYKMSHYFTIIEFTDNEYFKFLMHMLYFLPSLGGTLLKKSKKYVSKK